MTMILTLILIRGCVWLLRPRFLGREVFYRNPMCIYVSIVPSSIYTYGSSRNVSDRYWEVQLYCTVLTRRRKYSSEWAAANN